MRAKKFGVSALNDSAKKQIRAERFGSAMARDTSAASIRTGNTVSNITFNNGILIFTIGVFLGS